MCNRTTCVETGCGVATGCTIFIVNRKRLLESIYQWIYVDHGTKFSNNFIQCQTFHTVINDHAKNYMHMWHFGRRLTIFIGQCFTGMGNNMNIKIIWATISLILITIVWPTWYFLQRHQGKKRYITKIYKSNHCRLKSIIILTHARAKKAIQSSWVEILQRDYEPKQKYF